MTGGTADRRENSRTDTSPHRQKMSPEQSAALLSSAILKMGRIARDVRPPDFFAHAVRLMREVIPFSCGWWGATAVPESDQLPSVWQAHYVDLPETYLHEWLAASKVDPLCAAMQAKPGQVMRYAKGTPCAPLAIPIQELQHRHDIAHVMGLAVDDPDTADRLFVCMFRGSGDEPFSKLEEVLFSSLVNHALQLWRFGLLDMVKRGASVALRRTAIARRDGRLLFVGADIRVLLAAQYPEWDSIELPPELVNQADESPITVRGHRSSLFVTVQEDHVWIFGMQMKDAFSGLSLQEWRVAELFARGCSYKEVAQRVRLTPATVRTYLRRSYARLGVQNKAQLIAALEIGAMFKAD